MNLTPKQGFRCFAPKALFWGEIHLITRHLQWNPSDGWWRLWRLRWSLHHPSGGLHCLWAKDWIPRPWPLGASHPKAMVVGFSLLPKEQQVTAHTSRALTHARTCAHTCTCMCECTWRVRSYLLPEVMARDLKIVQMHSRSPCDLPNLRFGRSHGDLHVHMHLHAWANNRAEGVLPPYFGDDGLGYRPISSPKSGKNPLITRLLDSCTPVWGGDPLKHPPQYLNARWWEWGC